MANYGDISYGLDVGAGQTIKRKDDDTGYESVNAVTEEASANGDYTIKPDGTKAYFSFDSSDYDFANNKISDNGPFTSNNGTLTNFARNDGTVSGGVSIEDGAMKFDGVDGTGVNVGDQAIFNFTTALSFSTKIRIDGDANSAAGIIFSKFTSLDLKRSYVVSIRNSDKKILCYLRNDSDVYLLNGEISTSSLTVGQTYNIDVDWDGNEIKCYIDKVLDKTTSAVGTLQQTDTQFIIGGRVSNSITGNPNTENINGTINNLKIYNRSRTETEILNETTTYSTLSDGLIAQYSGRNFAGTEALPTTIYDSNFIISNGEREGIRFDGVDDYVYNNTFSFSGHKLGVMARVKLDSLIGEQAILGGYNIIFETNGNGLKFYSNVNGGQTASTSTLSIPDDGLEHSVGYYYDDNSGECMFMIDGNIEIVPLGNPYIGQSSLYIGSYRNSNRYIKGQILDFVFIEEKISEEEIKAYSQRTAKLFSDNNGSSGDFGVSGDLTVGGKINDTVSFVNGKVGLGTANPLESFHIKGSDGSLISRIENTLPTGFTMQGFINDLGQNYRIGIGGSAASLGVANKWFLYDATASSMRMVCDTTGNVGIGTATPGSKLSVVGLPTSATGLSAGDIYIDAGTLKIVT